MRTDTTGSAFRLGSRSRILAGAVLVTVFGSFALGSARTPSKTRTQSPSGSTTSRSAPATVTTSVRHRVVKGENLYRIALSYGISVADLCRANGIKDSSQVTEGRVLFVPVTRPAPRTASTASAPRKSPSGTSSTARKPSSGSMNATLSTTKTPTQLIKSSNRTIITNLDDMRTEAADTETEEIPAGEGSPKGISFSLIPSDVPFSWPVQAGIVRSAFGMRHGRQHAGIDICAPAGSPIYAARDGVISYSGRKFRGYGNVVMIDHGDGFSTVYAHNTTNLVHEGDPVVRGQIIARVGATGNATGAHCHFEIRNDNISVDPRSYLSDCPEDDAIFARGLPPRMPPGSKQATLPQPDLIP